MLAFELWTAVKKDRHQEGQDSVVRSGEKLIESTLPQNASYQIMYLAIWILDWLASACMHGNGNLIGD